MIPDAAIELALIANWDTEGDQKERMRAALEAAAPHMLMRGDARWHTQYKQDQLDAWQTRPSEENEMTETAFTEADIYAAAKHLATWEGEGWVFEPPIMDGVTRSGTAKEVYLRQAAGVLKAVAEQRAKPTPSQDSNV